jgi:BarA-like signal transduction histidine kinase
VELDDSPGSESGFHGTIYTITVGQTGGESDPDKVGYIREPRPYYGPKTGPYTFFGTYYVPDSAYPLSPIMASLGQADELNAHVRSAARSAAQYKRLILVDSKSKKLMQDVKSQPDNFVVPVEGLDRDRVIPIELGGITNQQVNYIQMARERLDRNSGIHDVMRGNISGTATATEVATADASSSIRIDYLKRQFVRATEQMLYRSGWYLWNDDRVFFPIGGEAAQQMGMGEPYFQGGGEPPASYDDIELEVDAYSMERTNEAMQQRRALEALQVVSNVAAAMPQAPYVNWEALLKQVGDSMNMPGMAQLIDKQALVQMQQQAAMQQQAEAMAQQGSVDDRGTSPQEYAGAV